MPFIVAEMSANHLGSYNRAVKIIDAARFAGADAIKLQTYDPIEMVGPHDYMIESGPWKGRKLIDLYIEAHTPLAWHRPLFEYAASIGLTAFSSPFCANSLAFLKSINCPIYKISSFEIVDTELIKAVARTGKPIIISTGMASFYEIDAAVDAALGCKKITLLKCTSAYPATLKDANLASLSHLIIRYQGRAHVGISDHTAGHAVAVSAAVQGASVIEKHLTLKRTDGGPDAGFSMEPEEFKVMVGEVRNVMDTVGSYEIGPTKSEASSAKLRRSLYFAKDMKNGQSIMPGDIRTARPALGLHPRDCPSIMGRKVTEDIKAGTPVTWTKLST